MLAHVLLADAQATPPNVTGLARPPPPTRLRLSPARQLQAKHINVTKQHRDFTMAAGPGPIRKAWYQWRMMRFPWRKKWLVGQSLHR